MITKKRKLSERKLMALSCGSYLLGIVCMTILGYFYNKIPVSYTHLDVYKRQAVFKSFHSGK